MRIARLFTIIIVIVQVLVPIIAIADDPIGGILGPGLPLPKSLDRYLSAGFPGKIDGYIAIKNIQPLYTEPKMPNRASG